MTNIWDQIGDILGDADESITREEMERRNDQANKDFAHMASNVADRMDVMIQVFSNRGYKGDKAFQLAILCIESWMQDLHTKFIEAAIRGEQPPQ